MVLQLIPDFDLKQSTWLGAGGSADFFGIVENISELACFLKEEKRPITLLGAGSNVLIRDGGIRGVVLRLGKDFKNIRWQGDQLVCGAGVLMSHLANFAQKNGLSNLEFISDIPGTIGGGLVSNAGAFGFSLSDFLVSIKTITLKGIIKEYKDFSQWSYRFSPIQNEIFIEATFKIKQNVDPLEILGQMKQYHEKRKTTQPQGVRTAGSTFKNPITKSAGFLLEKSGLKGYKENGAEMSSVHANFLINHHATGNQLEDFVLKMQQIVLQKQGVKLELEIKCLGER